MMLADLLGSWLADPSSTAVAAGFGSAATHLVSHGLKPWLKRRRQYAADLYAQANNVRVPGRNEAEFFWLEIPIRFQHTGELCATLSNIHIAIGFQDHMDDYVPLHRFPALANPNFDAGNAIIAIPPGQNVSETMHAALDEACLIEIGQEMRSMSVEIEAVEVTTRRDWSKRLLTFSSGGHVFYEKFESSGVWLARRDPPT